MSETLPHDHIKPFEDTKASKKEQVASMFDTIAGRYDFMNRFLSARVDVIWRKKAITGLKKYAPKQVIDIATGTGDLAIMEAKILQPEKIIGIDISEGMLQVGREKINNGSLNNIIELLKGDSENLQFEDNRFDAATAAFGVRNFENLEKGLSEMYRVLKPGGRLMIIEFSRPSSAIISRLYKFYMHDIAPRFAALFKQNRRAYEYLNESSQAFPERKDFTDILEKVGFKNTHFDPQTFGMCCIYTAEK